MTRSRRQEKDLRIAALSAITGFFCIAGGYLFLKVHAEASFFPGGLLLSTGLLLTCLSMILGVLAKSKSSRPDLAVLRREYDLYHADRRAIEFDENGWRLFWYEGEDVRPWSCLRQVYDLETLMVLGTETTQYWLPKMALQPDGRLDQLRALAESSLTKRQQLFEVALRPSMQVYIEAKVLHNWRRQTLLRFLYLVALTLLGYGVVSGAGDVPLKGLWALAFVPLFLILGEGLFYLAKYYREDWSKASPNAEVMSDCIGFRNKTTRWIVEYRQLIELREIAGAFMLYLDLNSYYLIPKRAFSPEQIVQFRDVVNCKR